MQARLAGGWRRKRREQKELSMQGCGSHSHHWPPRRCLVVMEAAGRPRAVESHHPVVDDPGPPQPTWTEAM